jgi:hypothetical protein
MCSTGLLTVSSGIGFLSTSYIPPTRQSGRESHLLDQSTERNGLHLSGVGNITTGAPGILNFDNHTYDHYACVRRSRIDREAGVGCAFTKEYSRFIV